MWETDGSVRACACACAWVRGCVFACVHVCVCACVCEKKRGVCVVVGWGGVNHLQRDVRRREALERRKLRHRRQHVLRVHLHAPATRRRDGCKTSERRRRRHKRAYATREQSPLDGRCSGLVWVLWRDGGSGARAGAQRRVQQDAQPRQPRRVPHERARRAAQPQRVVLVVVVLRWQGGWWGERTRGVSARLGGGGSDSSVGHKRVSARLGRRRLS